MSMMGPGTFEGPQKGIANEAQLIQSIWLHRWWVLLFAIFSASAGFVVAVAQVPMYTASAIVQLETRNKGLQLSTDFASMLEPDSEATTELEILKSRLVLDRVVKSRKLDVIAEPKYIPLIKNLLAYFSIPKPDWALLQGYAWNGDSIQVSTLDIPSAWLGKQLIVTKLTDQKYTVHTPDGFSQDGLLKEELVNKKFGLLLVIDELKGVPGTLYIVRKNTVIAAVNTLRRNLNVREKTKNTGIIAISVDDSSKTRGEAIVTAIVDAYVNQNIDRSAEEADRSLAFLSEQIPLIQKQLSDAEGELNAYRLQNSSIDLNFEAQSILERSVALDSQLSSLSLEETELSRRYTPNHPAYRALLDKKQRLSDEKAGLQESVKTLPATQQEILRRTRDVDVSQQIYLQLLNKSQELSVMKAGTVGNVRLIDAAAANPNPVSPKVPATVVQAMMAGLLLAIGVILLRTMLAKEIDSPDDLAGLGLPSLATIPFSRLQHKIGKRDRNLILSRENPTEMAVEALRSLRTNIFFAIPDSDRNVVCVTGPSPTVGKTFVCINLAYLAAQAGSRVLVIDGDMRRGKLGKQFNLSSTLPGLAQLLSGTCASSAVLQEVTLDTLNIVKSTKETSEVSTAQVASASENTYSLDINLSTRVPIDNNLMVGRDRAISNASPSITVIPRGQTPHNPAELLMSERLPEFLEWASHQFDMVFIDTPPVLAATDAQIIAKYSDFNVMVLRQGETTRREAEEVIKNFVNAKSQVNGFVVNAYSASSSKYGTQYGYRYSYQ